MSRWIHLTCALFLMLASGVAQEKKRVAVMDFEYGTVQNFVSAMYGSNQDVGKGISDMLVEKLLQGGKYRLIERNKLDKILAEQNFSNSDRADAATAAKIGRVLGVDAIIVGSITKFGRDDKSTTVGGGGIIKGPFGLGGVQKREAKAVCAISARLIDTSTGEILAAVTGDGTSKRSGASLVGAGGGGGSAAAGAFDTHAKNFGETLIGEAVTQAVTTVSDKLNDSAANVPTRKAEVSAIVADVSGKSLIINAGSKTGLKVGDTLEISRAGRTIKDPTTGKVLKTITSKIGTATVTEIDADSATLEFSGAGAPKVGDLAKSPQ
jgi:curli biogenesis system outer membrane secretion channel CsgG